MTAASNRIGQDASHYYVGLQWIVVDRIMDIDPFPRLPGGRVTSRFGERVLVVYVKEFSTWFRTCAASYPSTSPPWSLRSTPSGAV
jgi:hypothetical protein